MSYQWTFIFLLNAAVVVFSPGAPAKQETGLIIGRWECDPYSAKGSESNGTAMDHPTFYANGKYDEVSSLVIKAKDLSEISLRYGLKGTWKYVGKFIFIKFDQSTMLYSSNQRYSLESGQRALNDQLRKKNWAKEEVLVLKPGRLIVKTVDSMHADANRTMRCARKGDA